MIKIDKQRKFAKVSKIAICVLVLVLVFAGLGLKLFLDSFEPTPNQERNISETVTTMYLDFPDSAPSRGIIRTFDKKEYDGYSEGKLAKIRKEVGGAIEGDIPALHLPGERIIRIVLQNKYGENVTPDTAPTVKMVEYSNTAVLPKSDSYLEVEGKDWDIPLKLDVIGYYLDFGDYYKEKEADGFFSIFFIEIIYMVEAQEYVSVSSFSVTNEW